MCTTACRVTFIPFVYTAGRRQPDGNTGSQTGTRQRVDRSAGERHALKTLTWLLKQPFCFLYAKKSS